MHSSRVILSTSPLGACWDFSLVVGLEENKGVGPENQHCFTGPLSQRRQLLFSRQFRVNTTGGEDATVLGMGVLLLLELRGPLLLGLGRPLLLVKSDMRIEGLNVPNFIRVFPHSHILMYRIPCFSI